MKQKGSPAALAARVAKGDTGAASRAVSWVVDEAPGYEQLTRLLFAHAGRSHKVGLCGPPGAGKSTLLGALIKHARAQGRKIGALVIDPSSSFSGGAFLGDRLRIQQHALDSGVFIRSLASRGTIGGVSATIYGAVHVMEAWGADLVFIETVGTGQDEVAIAKVADTTLYVTSPSLGDEIQAMKAGTMEVADLFVVNKADLPDTERAVGDIRRALSLIEKSRRSFEPPVLAVSALNETGIEDVMVAVSRHRAHLEATGEGVARRKDQLREEVSLYITRKLYRDTLDRISARHLDDLIAKKTDPLSLGKKLLTKKR